MPSNTANLNLYKIDTATDGNDTFNINVALNDNWDKIDIAVIAKLLEAKGYTDTKISELINAAPGALDTLGELANALGDDPNYRTTILNAIAAKASQSDLTNLTTTVTSHTLALADMTNPNLLINGDFQVWQRGANKSFASGLGYTADRWYMWTGGTPNILKNPYALIWTCGGNDNLGQIIEVNSRVNRKLTLSLYANIPAGVEIGVVISDSASIMGASTTVKGETIVGIGTWKTYVVNIPAHNYNNSLKLNLNCNASVGTIINIAYVKLEVGDKATPFVPKTYAEEISLCQRYYETIETLGSGLLKSCSISGVVEGSLFKVVKRVPPTINIYSEVGTLNNIRNIENYIEYPVVVPNIDVKGFRQVDYSGTAFPVGTYSYGYIADAEIY